MATSKSCDPLSDTRTYTYSDLEGGFTPQKSCLQHTYTSAPNGYDYYYSSTRGSDTTSYISLQIYRGRNPACFPSNFPEVCSYTGTFTEEIANPYQDLMATTPPGRLVIGSTRVEQHYVYSPGTCPEDYATVSTKVDTEVANVTSAICCPMQFSLISGTICRSQCNSAVIEDRTMSFDSTIVNLFAPTVKVAWDASDLVRWRMAPATPTPTTSLSAPTSALLNDGTSSNLSSGARIGIAIGASAIGIAAITTAILLWRRRMRDRKTSSKDDTGVHKAELPSEGKMHTELADDARAHEVDARDEPEGDAEQRPPAEMDGGWTGWEAPGPTDLSWNAPEQARVHHIESDSEHRTSAQEMA